MDDVPLDEFSTGRALIHMSDLINDDQPHPSGNADNAVDLEIISNKFRALGYIPEVQKTLACTLHYPGCTQVENFIAVLKGTGSGDAIMLTTHYDSVPAGPGAGDAGAGVAAIIEIARILKVESPPLNDIIFLITDGEEGGLRGASGFANEHPLMKNVKLAVNLEARGAAGPSTMFETHDGNFTLIKQYAGTSSRPVANSLSYELYKLLPNDTDYSIYKPMGVAGLNFAFTGDVALYHSSRDDIAHLDKASLQHHGDNALDAIHAFQNFDLNTLNGESDATYFDLFGRILLNWSSGLNLPLSVLALLVIAAATFKCRKGWKQGLFAAGAILAVILLTVLLGWLLSFPLGKWPQLFYLDHPHPWPGRIALILSAVFASWVIARLFRKRELVCYNMLACTVGILLALLSLVSAVLMTGATYQFLVPALAMALGFIVDIVRKHERYIWAVHLGLITTAYMALYHFIAIEVIVPYSFSQARVAPLIPLGLMLFPIFLRADRKAQRTSRMLGAGLGVIMVVATAMSAFLPGFNEAHPRMQNLVIRENVQTSESVWVSETYGGEDKDFLSKAGFSDTREEVSRYGLYNHKRHTKAATYRNTPSPYFNLVSDEVDGDKRIFTMDIQAKSNGYGLTLVFSRDNVPLQIFMNDQLAAEQDNPAKFRNFSIRGPGEVVYRIKMVYPKEQTVDFALVEAISLTPAQTEGLADLRPINSAPGFYGDRIEVFRHLVFQ